MKGKAHAEDVPVQDFLKKKKKKKRKEKQENSTHEQDASVEEPELGRNSPLLFEEEAAAQGSQGSKKKKKKAKIQGGKEQQASIAKYCVRVEQKISNGTGLEAPQKKKKKRRSEGSPAGVTCVPVNEHSPGGCQDSTVDYVFVTKPPKKKRRNLPGVGEEGEEPPRERPRGDNREGAKRKRKKRRESSTQEGTGGTAQHSPLSSPEHHRPGGHREWPFPAEEEEGDSDAASAMSELSEEAPAGFSTPSKPAGRAPKPPARAKKVTKSRMLVLEESSSESEGMTPEPSASSKKKEQNSSFAAMAASDEVSLDEEEDPDTLTSSLLDLDTARQELEEFIPHVKNISDSSIRKMAGRDLARFKQFKKQGIAVKFGRFTQKENNQIRRNVEEFLSISGIDSAEKLLFTSRYPEDKETIHRLKAKHEFCQKISEGIPRPWRLIYYRARKMFDPNNYKGRYTKEEKEKLMKYYTMHGNDWKKISELMSRSNLSVAMKFSEIKSAINYGPWTNEEIQKLKHAVKEVIKRKLEMEGAASLPSLEQSKEDPWVDSEQLCQQLPWTEIEAKVGSRYWRQCKQKWNSILTKKMSKGQQSRKGIKALQSKIAVIKRLHEMQLEDANEVNWEELSNALGGVPRTYVQATFYRIKVSYVPFWQKKSFSEIIDFLVEYKLPEFEEKLKKMEGKHLNSGNLSASQEKKAFLLSDIFDSSEESD